MPNSGVKKGQLKKSKDLPGRPAVKALPFHCRGHRFNPWLGN